MNGLELFNEDALEVVESIFSMRKRSVLSTRVPLIGEFLLSVYDFIYFVNQLILPLLVCNPTRTRYFIHGVANEPPSLDRRDSALRCYGGYAGPVCDASDRDIM